MSFLDLRWQLYSAAICRHEQHFSVLAAGLPAQNGHVVRREDSRGSLSIDPGTPDSIEVRTLPTVGYKGKVLHILKFGVHVLLVPAEVLQVHWFHRP